MAKRKKKIEDRVEEIVEALNNDPYDVPYVRFLDGTVARRDDYLKWKEGAPLRESLDSLSEEVLAPPPPSDEELNLVPEEEELRFEEIQEAEELVNKHDNGTGQVPELLPELDFDASPESRIERITIELQRLKEEKLKLLEDRLAEVDQLPHRSGRKWFKWQREFMEEMNKDLFLTAANQVGKSTVGIATAIEWAGNKTLWPKLWPGRVPRQIWYLYPSSQFGTSEVKTKWIPDMLPRGKMKDDSNWGWRIEYQGAGVNAIHFNSGCSIYFKYYTQDIMNLQGSTIAAVFCFTGDSLVSTEYGQKRIDEVQVGEKVWTKEGVLRTVLNVRSREADVIRRGFSDGSYIDATPDHKFWTENRGWVEFKDLTSDDILITRGECQSLDELKRQYSTTGSTEGTQTLPIEDTSILEDTITISSVSHNLKPSIYTEKFGSFLTELFRQTKSFTTKMGISPITKFQIWNSQQEANTTPTIKLSHGLMALLGNIKKEFVSFVKNPLKPEPPKLRLVDGAPKNVGRKKVFCLEVQEHHNFFVNNICVKNCDEELPEHYFQEINQRRMNYNGYFRMFFTATLGQKIWFDTMECQGTKDELFPKARKMQISLYDCKTYEDGSPSHITDEYIQRAINLCKSEAEIQKRVMGRFAVEGGLKYHAFQRKFHVVERRPLPKDWVIYVGVDIGGGRDPTDTEGYKGHPSCIQFVAVSPDYTQALCFDAWVGDDELTVDLDVYEKLLTMLQKHEAFDRLGGIFYDYHSKDFGTICQRKGLSVLKAEKNHEIGESVINVLFKNNRLKIWNLPQHEELIFELTNLKRSTAKRAARDDAVDALRYALTRVPFDWQKIGIEGVDQRNAVQKDYETPTPTRQELLNKARREGLHARDEMLTIDQEISAWNELYDY